jgi:ureidoglycolate hydrolase
MPGNRMSQVIEIKVEALTDEAFAPFGQLIGPREGTPAFGGERLRSWRLEYDADSATEVIYMRTDRATNKGSRI